MKIAWHGTAALSLRSERKSILFDPFVPLEGSAAPTTLEDYVGARAVLVTHGHFDHIWSLPDLWRATHYPIYCTKTPAKSLERLGVEEASLHVIEPGDRVGLGPFKITVLRGHHAMFDHELILDTMMSPRMRAYASNLVPEAFWHLNCPEAGETVGYLVEADGKSVLVLGSLGNVEDMDLPRNVDLMVIPYQGRSELVLPALDMVEAVIPKRVFLDHFDDAFPPLSNQIDTSGIQEALADLISVTVPDYGVEYQV